MRPKGGVLVNQFSYLIPIFICLLILLTILLEIGVKIKVNNKISFFAHGWPGLFTENTRP